MEQLFGVDDAPFSLRLPSDPKRHPGLGQVSPLLVEGYHRFAHDFAIAATSDPDSLEDVTGCDVVSEGENECRRRLIDERIARVLRRPLDADDVADFEGVFERGAELGGGFAGGVRAVLEVALQSPEFLYRVEFGEPLDVPSDDPRAGWGRPTPFEMASRLSYLYWKSAPDDELLEAAQRGGLRDRQEIAEQAARLLGDERAKRMARPFYFELLGIQRESWLEPSIMALLVRETEHFVDDVTFGERGDFRSLLTSPATWLNAELASYYGISDVSGDEFVHVNLDPSRSAGLLTQGSFLATGASSNAPNPFRRGLAIYTGLLCQEMPPPPADVVETPIPDPNATNRERWEVATSPPACAVCHRETNGIGFAFEHYDQWARWRDTDKGLPIDTSGEITVTDAAGRFDGAVELARLIAESDDAERCFAGKWLTYASGRPDSPADACSRSELEQHAGGPIIDLLHALATTDAFLYMPVSSEGR